MQLRLAWYLILVSTVAANRKRHHDGAAALSPEEKAQARRERERDRLRVKRAAAKEAKLADAAAGADVRDYEDVVRARTRRSALEEQDRRLDEVQRWYEKGFTSPGDLARLTGLHASAIARSYIPAIQARLSRHQTLENRQAQVQLALERELGLLRTAWTEMMRCNAPGAKVNWAYVIANCHRELARLQGLYATQRDQQVYLVAINTFLSGVTEMVAARNDPTLIGELEQLLAKFIAAGRRTAAEGQLHVQPTGDSRLESTD